jgi:hypothetical protein
MMKKISSILLAVTLVLSFAVVATPVGADVPYAKLTANITAPADDFDIMGGAQFKVFANVTNTGNWKARDVMATIGISGNATLKPGEVATKVVCNDPIGCAVNFTKEVSWTLVCTGGGDVSINVTPSGKDDGTLNDIIPSRLIHDEISIHQEQVLKVAIFTPDGDDFDAGATFDITANVENISSLNATDVQLTLSFDRYVKLEAGEYATRTVGSLKANHTSANNYSWTLECTDDGFSRITVTPSGEVDDEAIPDDAVIPATVKVRQGDFDSANITLVEGWNLISLPLIPLDPHIDVVLAGISDDVKAVWYWDAAAGHWHSYKPGGPQDLTKMEDGKAYWIDMEAAQPLDIAGREMPEGDQLPRYYPVVVGWNMVGFKSTTANNATSYLDGTNYVRIYYYVNGQWHLIPTDSAYMVPGLGYWVAFLEPGTIYP